VRADQAILNFAPSSFVPLMSCSECEYAMELEGFLCVDKSRDTALMDLPVPRRAGCGAAVQMPDVAALANRLPADHPWQFVISAVNQFKESVHRANLPD